MKSAVENRVKYYSSFLNREFIAAYLSPSRNRKISIADHLDAAAQWICRAQDATPDDGVARSYSLVYQPYFKRKGWFPSYPETTGYIIPSMFDYAHLTGRQDIYDRAVRMAQWETAVQMENGAVQGGTIADKPTPAIFNTGQVIFGWLRAYEETGKERFIGSAVKAGKYLIANQEADGAWRKNLSNFVSDRMPTFTYNTRTAWALFLLGEKVKKQAFTDGAIKNIEFAIEQQHENGWFPNNCLSDPDQPLLHTIAYCIRGILEIGDLSGNERYVQQAQKAADALLEKQRADGSLAGRFNAQWEGTGQWSCLTGDAQTSIIWNRLHGITGDDKYRNGAKKMNVYLKKRQLIFPGKKDIHGGICGSYPIHGLYGSFEILNWAVKFFIDALILERALGEKDQICIS